MTSGQKFGQKYIYTCTYEHTHILYMYMHIIGEIQLRTKFYQDINHFHKSIRENVYIVEKALDRNEIMCITRNPLSLLHSQTDTTHYTLNRHNE